jgi:putative NADPH-quinone reductase
VPPRSNNDAVLSGNAAGIAIGHGHDCCAQRWIRYAHGWAEFLAHSLKSLERNILAFIGINPVRASIIGMVEGVSAQRRAKWLQQLRGHGARGD